MKQFCFLENIIKKMKRQLTDWEKIFTSHIPLKDLYPEYAKSSYNSMRKKKLKISKRFE